MSSLLLLFRSEEGGDHTITAAGIASAEALGAIALNGQIAAVGLESGEALGAPGVNGTIAADGVASGEAFGQPAVGSQDHQIAPASVASAEAIGAPGLLGQIEVAGFAEAQAFGEISLNGSIAPMGVDAATALGQPEVGEQQQQQEAPRLGAHHAPDSTSFVYTSLRPWNVPRARRLTATGIRSASRAGRPMLVRGRSARRRLREENDLIRLAA